jgi:hypothetical protein
MFIFGNFVQMPDAPPHPNVHVPMIEGQRTPMQSMGSIEVLPPNSLHTPIKPTMGPRILILEINT